MSFFTKYEPHYALVAHSVGYPNLLFVTEKNMQLNYDLIQTHIINITNYSIVFNGKLLIAY